MSRSLAGRPLQGRTVLVTRPAHQASALETPLRDLGATPYVLPAIAIQPSSDPAFDDAVSRLGEFDWVILTSVNGVTALRERMDRLGADWPVAIRLGVIGPATASAAAAQLKSPDAMPDEYISEAIAETLGDVRGLRVLLPRADLARSDLAEILAASGAIVENVAAYTIAEGDDGEFELPEQAPDAIALTSSAGVRGTLANLTNRGRESWMAESPLVCIGPITARTVTELGFSPAAVARDYTIPGLVDAIVELLGVAEVAR